MTCPPGSDQFVMSQHVERWGGGDFFKREHSLATYTVLASICKSICSPVHSQCNENSECIETIYLHVSGHWKQIFEMIYSRMFTQMV